MQFYPWVVDISLVWAISLTIRMHVSVCVCPEQYSVSGKNETKFFTNIFYTTQAILMKFGT